MMIDFFKITQIMMMQEIFLKQNIFFFIEKESQIFKLMKKRYSLLNSFNFAQLINQQFCLQIYMIDEYKYNTYCTHPDCIASKNALFYYTLDNYHVQNRHQVQILHPLAIPKMFPVLHQNQQTLHRDKNQLLRRVDGYITAFCENINNFMKKKYLSSFLSVAKTQLSTIRVNNADEIYRKLQQGDHQILKEFIRCSALGSTSQYPFYSFIQNKIRQIDQKIAKDIQDLYKALEKIIGVTFERKEDLLKIAQGQFEIISDFEKQEIRKTFNLGEVNLPLGNDNHIVAQAISPESSEDMEANENQSDEALKKRRKRKQISKEEKKIKQIQIQHKKSDEKKNIVQPVDFKKQITFLAPDEIRINKCFKSQLTFQHIKKEYKDLTKIHIFHKRFARKEILRRLFSIYKNLKTITLNCPHQFQSNIVTQTVSKQAISKIENLELKWDFNRFFKEYHVFKFFPTNERKQTQNLTKTNIQLDLLLIMKKNESLSVNSERQIDELVQSSFQFQSVKTLHFTKASQEKTIPCFAKLLRLNKLSQLNTLYLSEISLVEAEWQFGQFLKMNKGITTLVISYCKISPSSPSNPVKIFQSLQLLPNLRRFSFSPSPFNTQNYIRTENIFCLSNLEELHLSSCNFVTNNFKSYDDSSMLRRIQNLRELTQLSLYACNPVFSDLFNYIDVTTLAKIQFLNVGYTQVDNKFAINFLPLMKKLEYLNIDSTNLTGEFLLKGFFSYNLKNNHHSPLKYLSIESKLRTMNYNVKEMKELSLYIPNLTYIQISNCKSLRGYGFEEYKLLKYLVVDNQQEIEVEKKLSPEVELINLKLN